MKNKFHCDYFRLADLCPMHGFILKPRNTKVLVSFIFQKYHSGTYVAGWK